MRENRLLVVGTALGAALCAVIAAPLVQGRVYVRDDLASYYLPWRAFYAESLARGESFLWSPYLFAGFYAHGEGQAGMMHPLHWVLYRFLPLAAAFNLDIALSYVAALAGTYLFLRRWRVRRSAAMFGGLVFAFSGFNLLHAVHPSLLAVLAHTPWLLLAIEVIVRSRNPRAVAGAGLAIGLMTASQLLLGHPQAVWLSVVLEGLYLLFRVRTIRGTRRLATLAVSKVLGVLAGAVQLLPTWDVVAASWRAAPVEFRTSLVPLDLIQFVAPYLAANRGFGGDFAQDQAIYTGAVASTLMVFCVLHRREIGRSRYLMWPALGVALLGFLLGLGEQGYIYRVEAALPLLGQFRTPSRYTLLIHFGMAVASAVAFAHLVNIAAHRRIASWRSLAPLAIVPVAGALVVGASLWLRATPQRAPEITAQLGSSGDALLGLALVTMGAVLVVAAARGVPWALPAILVFTVVDQGYYGLTFLRRPYPPMALEAFVNGHAMPPGTSEHRVQSDNTGLTMKGFRLAGGYSSFRPNRQLDWLDGQRLRLVGVRWVQTRVPWARTQEEISGPNWNGHVRPAPRTYDLIGQASSWAEVIDPLPRVRLVTREYVSREPRHDIASIDIATTALVSEPLGLDSGPPGSVDVVTDAQGHLQIAAAVSSRQLLVVSEGWHSGWQVSVDGRPATVVRVYGDLLGCVLDAGRYEVEFRFRPASFRTGAWLSAAGVLLLFLTFAIARR